MKQRAARRRAPAIGRRPRPRSLWLLRWRIADELTGSVSQACMRPGPMTVSIRRGVGELGGELDVIGHTRAARQRWRSSAMTWASTSHGRSGRASSRRRRRGTSTPARFSIAPRCRCRAAAPPALRVPDLRSPGSTPASCRKPTAPNDPVNHSVVVDCDERGHERAAAVMASPRAA
jgi:hypothetical protein